MSSRKTKHQQHIEEYHQLRVVRKQIKRNRDPDPPRRKARIQGGLADPGALDELALPESERVMPRGERERRRAIWTTALAAQQGETKGEGTSPAEETPGIVGVVTEVSTGMCRVRLHGRELLCGVRGSLSAADTGFTNVVAVGDRVAVSESGDNQGIVEAILPRRSVLARPDVFYSHLQQVIVANADQSLIVASWREPALWPELLDRCLIAAERNRLPPVLCVNKVDLAEDGAACRAAMRPYLALGYRVLFTSVVTGEGIAELRDILRGRTTALSGLSGVGKSSLLNAAQPGLRLRASEVSERKHEGRHTTTQAHLLPLEEGGFVVDTPGIREWGLANLPRAELVRYYPEIAEAGRECRFTNCAHIHEPGCAVKAAARQGRIAAARYESYKKIYASLPA